MAYSRSLSADVTNQASGSDTRVFTSASSSAAWAMKRMGSSAPRSRRTKPASRSARSAGPLRVFTDIATAPRRRAARPVATSSGATQRGGAR